MCIEIITVRTAQAEQCSALLEKMAALSQFHYHPSPKWFACYRNVEVDNEMSIHIGWGEKTHLEGKTPCGLYIARFLAQHGLIHHTIWQRSSCARSTELAS
jgi:hypothetical protein